MTDTNNKLDDDWGLEAPTTMAPPKKDFDDLTEEEKMQAAKPSKACLITDPDCEACQ